MVPDALENRELCVNVAKLNSNDNLWLDFPFLLLFVYPKQGPVIPLSARVTISCLAFFTIYGNGVGWGQVRCLTRLVDQFQALGEGFPTE